MPSTNTVDPSEWMKPKQQRPARRSLYGALRKESNLKCLILTTLIYGCIVAIIWCRVTIVTKVDIDFTAFPITSTREISPCDDGSIYIPTAFVVMLYLLYLVECWHCKAWLQLKFEKTDLNSAYQKVHEIRQAQPVVWWKAVCYHYVRRTREITRYRNGNAYTCTQVYYERVNSHVAAGCFFFALCGMKDVSRELIDLEKHAATKIQLSKGFLFANLATAREFQEQRAAFFQEQERYDDYMEMREGMDLSNVHFKESFISWTSPDNPPWFAKIPVFWLCNFLLLSWPLRLILELNTAHVHYQVNKLFGVNYMSPSGSELLLSAPRSHGLPINNHQPRLHNRAISSHHSRLSNRSRRRTSVVAASDQEGPEETPLLAPGEEPVSPLLTEKDSELDAKAKDHQQSSNNEEDTSPSSSGRIFFPQWRSSFFSRNFRFARQSGYKLTRSVTLLMTKPERLEFLASTQHSRQQQQNQQFPDEFGYYGDSDEGARLLRDEAYYPSSSPPPPFPSSSPPEEMICDRRLTTHQRDHHGGSMVMREDGSCRSTNSLAPSYSQALLMEPSERQSSMEPSGESTCEVNSTAVREPGLDANLTNEPESTRGLQSTTLVEALSSHLSAARDLHENRAHYEHQISHQPNRPSGTTSGMSDATADNVGERSNGESGRTTNHPSQSSPSGNNGHTENDLCDSQGRASQHAERRLHRSQHRDHDQAGSSTSISSSHYHRVSARLASAGSSLVLNTVAPREMTMVQIDLTQPIVVTVPRDPLRESGVVSSASSSSTAYSRQSGFSQDDEPPTYVEALRTSRPVFLPTLARIRRCFTERDIASRFTSNRTLWLDEIADVEAPPPTFHSSETRRNNSNATAAPTTSADAGNSTSRV